MHNTSNSNPTHVHLPVRMFSKGRHGGKEHKRTSSSNTFKGHSKSTSTASIAATLPEFSTDYNDLNSISSNNSFSSLSNTVQRPATGNWTFNRSLESLHSLPNVGSFTKPYEPSKKITNQKRSLFNNKNFRKRSKMSGSYNGTTPPPLDSTTIMEDDESEQALNVPVLPAFNKGGNKPNPTITVPGPTVKKERPARVNFNFGDEDYFFNDANSQGYESDSSRVLKSTIEDDFNVNFSKDSQVSNGRNILQIRKRKGLGDRRQIATMSSSDDDASTESDASSIDMTPTVYNPPEDNTSLYSNGTTSSKKNIFRNIFKKRTYSHGSEKSDKSAKSKEEVINEKRNIDDEYEKLDEKGTFSFPKRSSSSISHRDAHSKPDTIEGTNEKQDSSLSTSDKTDGDALENQRSLHDVSDIASNGSKGEHFLKNIFHLDGLLGGGGLVPNSNLSHNTRIGDSVYDEENPPLNFQDEIEREAQVLVGHVFKNPLDDLRRRRKNKKQSQVSANQTGKEHNDGEGHNVDDTTDGISSGADNSSAGFYVPDRAHLPMDPFDDLQNFDEFSIDVPDNVVEKPRKYKAGIQSALLQLYNTHLMPSTNSTLTNSFGGATTNDTNDSDTNYDSEMNDSTVDLHMNIGQEVRNNGLVNFRHDAATTLDTEMPVFGSKLHELTEDAETELGGLKRAHNRASSFQSFIRPDKLKLNKPNGKKATTKTKEGGVTFDLPDFKISNINGDTASEQEEMRGYRNLKKRARFNKKLTKETKARITVHIADVLERQRFILTLCKAFMLFGAPTHRLEEYMSMTAQVLEIDGSFIYFPGCMLVSFGDLNARTSEMKLVRCAQGLDLGKLDEVHDVYKNVVHDRLGTVEGYRLLDEIMNRKPKFNAWWCILFYSIASLGVAPWSFGGSWIDLPICFGIGAIIAFLQFVVCPKNTLYSSVFEVTSSIVASFIARAIGSINGGNTFCYAAIVQSPLALILPGYIILCGSLELQSRNIVAGSVRMFYAFIYSLMLSFGITLGAALYGWIDESATSTTVCKSNISPWYYFLFVPIFTVGIALTNQASWSQLPMMIVISGCGYIVTYFSSLHFRAVTELNATLGCFIIGLVSNIYSRALKSFNRYFTARGTFMTVSLMLPGIFVQVPSGIASKGSVFTGITTANHIVRNTTLTDSDNGTNSLSFGMVMIQVALGISVGLYLSNIIVYPFGKKKTGLFTL